ncbi:MAG: histone deacetylase [Gemmatimonadota bacterium]|jgi:acetoin utilization deacetylase AcuC-like enzyme
MDVFHCDQFALPLPEGHRFPLEKYRLLRERVTAWNLASLRVPEAASDRELVGAHDPAYVERVVSGSLTREEIRRLGFPWSPELVERSRRSVGGTLAASRAALGDGISVSLAGGTHHAFVDHGQGFCVFNDVAVAVRTLQTERRVERVAILDLDVHQGNGTASIFRDDSSVFTLSVHGANNFPFQKESSDLDVELPDRTGDDAYLPAARDGVRAALATAPDLAFYLAGADPFEADRLGRLSVSKAGLAERDRSVFELCREAGVPTVVVMSGGYGKTIEDTVDIHFTTVRTAFLSHAPRASV